MKLYAPEPDVLVRINIKRQGEKTFHINLCETTVEEATEFAKKAIHESNPPIFNLGRRTTVEFREAIGGTNGKTTSFNFLGWSPEETKIIIINALNIAHDDDSKRAH